MKARNACPFRYIFERMDNLRLLILIEDLRHHRVAFNTWYKCIDGIGDLCPLSHGANNHARLGNFCEESIALDIGISTDQVDDFVGWWDGWHKGDNSAKRKKRTASLLRVLKAIWRERLEDAIAVQEMMINPELNAIIDETQVLLPTIN